MGDYWYFIKYMINIDITKNKTQESSQNAHIHSKAEQINQTNKESLHF